MKTITFRQLKRFINEAIDWKWKNHLTLDKTFGNTEVTVFDIVWPKSIENPPNTISMNVQTYRGPDDYKSENAYYNEQIEDILYKYFKTRIYDFKYQID